MSQLLVDTSPHGSLAAIVEEHDGVIYFYLWGGEESNFGVRSCWVRNLKPAPKDFSLKGRASDEPPLLPASYCAHPKGAPRLDPKSLSVVWLEAGDGAALLEDAEILAVIPPWSGEDGFHGYARDCLGETPVSWDLDEDNLFHDRIAEAQEYWSSWEEDPNPFFTFREQYMDAMEKNWGPHSAYFAIDGGQWPNRALVQTEVSAGTVLSTIGVCVRAQPTVEMYFEDPSVARRIELALFLSKDFDKEQIAHVSKHISWIARFPWIEITWFGTGHTIGTNEFEGFPSLLLVSHPTGEPPIEVPSFRGDPVNLLWLVPITQSELAYKSQHGGKALIEKLNAARTSPLHERDRKSIV